MLVVGDQQMTVATQDGPGRVDVEVFGGAPVLIDAHETAGAEEQFAVAPRRPFGVTGRLGKLFDLDLTQSLGQRVSRPS